MKDIYDFSLSVFTIMGQLQSGEEKEVGLQDIQELYRKFASECPSGNLHLHEFKRIFGINSSSTVEESAYMEIVFESFDTNKVRKQQKVSFCVDFTTCRSPLGWQNRLPGIRGRGSPGSPRKTGGQTQVVLQSLRQGRKRLPGQKGSEPPRKGTAFTPAYLSKLSTLGV